MKQSLQTLSQAVSLSLHGSFIRPVKHYLYCICLVEFTDKEIKYLGT